MRRPNRAEVRAKTERPGVMGVFEAAAQGIEAGRTRAAGLSEQSQLPARLHAGTHRGRVSGGGMVSLVRASGAGAHYPGTPDRRAGRRRIRLRKEPAV